MSQTERTALENASKILVDFGYADANYTDIFSYGTFTFIRNTAPTIYSAGGRQLASGDSLDMDAQLHWNGTKFDIYIKVNDLAKTAMSARPYAYIKVYFV